MATFMLKQQLLVKEQIKTLECYEPIHEHNSYFNVMGHVAPPATTRATTPHHIS